MTGVDHDALGFRPFTGKPGEDAVEDTQPAPADKAVVERLVRAVTSRCVLPLQSVADHVDDAAHHASIVDPWDTMRQREIGRYPRHLALAQQKQITYLGLLSRKP